MIINKNAHHFCLFLYTYLYIIYFIFCIYEFDIFDNNLFAGFLDSAANILGHITLYTIYIYMHTCDMADGLSKPYERTIEALQT